MKLENYLNLPTEPTIPTVREKYWECTIVIEYKDGEIARIDIGAGDTGEEFVSKRPLLDFMKNMCLFKNDEQAEKESKTFLKDYFEKSSKLTQIFQTKNSFIKQVWLAPF